MSLTSLGEPLHRLTHAYRSFMRSAVVDAGIGLPITHFRVLKAIWKRERCTAHFIAQCMRRDKAQITRVLNELLGEGLIVKVDNPEDRRSQLLRLTSDGQTMVGRMQTVEQIAMDHMTRHLKPDDVDTFITLANVMADNLQDAAGQDGTINTGESNHAKTGTP
ncbi:MarR family transcriptional regulator [Marinobacter halodurans]|uniref:MarR family transcriptional regulator n=1 Tax=Marinobacter halodurans TaxID=2528979 RepID=A0ABY1ZIH1_9GAMM|nr:MarR family transcriptional regulator [Marinobacter halodurans]TBW51279.1 MarR family transcriptional regulator [Marinobacter halodurans]